MRSKVSVKPALNGSGDFVVRKAVRAPHDPCGPGDCQNTEETGVLLGQLPFDEFRRLERFNGVVLREVADQDVGVDSDRCCH